MRCEREMMGEGSRFNKDKIVQSRVLTFLLTYGCTLRFLINAFGKLQNSNNDDEIGEAGGNNGVCLPTCLGQNAALSCFPA